MIIFTIGYSTHPLDAFIGLLTENSVQQLVDVRAIPRSRHNPRFNADSLPGSLKQAGIGYAHRGELGGLRKARKDSPNMGWHNASFRGYADYMLTPEFNHGLSELIDAAGKEPVTIMCAKAVPWRCHRALIADALMVRDIMGPDKWQDHKLTQFAQVAVRRMRLWKTIRRSRFEPGFQLLCRAFFTGPSKGFYHQELMEIQES